MCFRLLASVGGFESAEVERLGSAEGLDVSPGPQTLSVGNDPSRRFVHIAWGACACSLYTRKEGRGRVVGLVERLLERGPVQLLLMNDSGPDFQAGPVAPIALEELRAQGLAALDEGRVAEIVRIPSGA
jgi:hypothetical protein